MKRMSMRVLSLSAALSLLAMIGPAHAVVDVTATSGFAVIADGAPGQSLIANFDNYLAPDFTITGGQIVIGDVYGCSGQCAANPAFDYTYYLNVRPGTYSPATLELSDSVLQSFSLYWGSIDTYNSIAFFNDATLIQSFSGADIDALTGATANGSQSSFSGNQRINFDFEGLLPNRIVFASTEIAFESDNFFGSWLPAAIISPVPEPGTWALLLAGFATLGFSLRRRAKPAPALSPAA
jgi:hypothetical protein